MDASAAFEQQSHMIPHRSSKEAAVAKHTLPGEAVVTSLCLSSDYIILAMDDGSIHRFGSDGEYQMTLEGHTGGVWATGLWQDTLVSGGVDCRLRVWSMVTRECAHVLIGHTSTIRCLKWVNSATVVTGSRDSSLRVWNIETGDCLRILEGHGALVQCLSIHGDLVVSGSYDADCKVWSPLEGICLKTLTGHTQPIYAIAFDGKNIITGSLDTTVRVWNVASGACTAVLEGHTSVVSHVDVCGDIIATAGADGLLRVWSLANMTLKFSLDAHENSVTDMQLHERCVVTGGSDGCVKLWNLETGQLLKEMGDPAKAVWKVAFGQGNSVIVASCRDVNAVLEVYRFDNDTLC